MFGSMKPFCLARNAALPGILAILVLVGCGSGPDYRALTPAEVGDLRSAIGEKRPLLDVAEYGPTIHVILEFPRSAAIQTVDADCVRAMRNIQDELRTGDHSRRPVIVWGHSEPNADATFRLIGYAETASASEEVTWKSNTQADRELPVPKSR